MFVIAIAPPSRFQVPFTRFDKMEGKSFDSAARAEQMCSDLNQLCGLERFEVGFVHTNQRSPLQLQERRAA